MGDANGKYVFGYEDKKLKKIQWNWSKTWVFVNYWSTNNEISSNLKGAALEEESSE